MEQLTLDIGIEYIMTLDITGVIFSTTINTFKNYPTASNSINIPSQSYTAGQYRVFTVTVNLDIIDSIGQILNNFSFASSNYYIGGLIQVNANSNFIVQTRARTTSSQVSIDIYVINNTGGTLSSPAFTFTVDVKRFTAPFS